MKQISGNFMVIFEKPFWIGVFESQSDKDYEVAKVVFGAEPSEAELYDFIIKNFNKLPFYKSKLNTSLSNKDINHKRMQRIIKKQQSQTVIGTKAQNAIKKQHESNKLKNKKLSKEKKEEEKERQFKLKQDKRKEKHKGH